MHLRLATRGSALALTQSRWVAARLTEIHADLSVELVIVKTEGDADQTRSLAAIGGRGVFVKAIEDSLLDGTADFAVHSLKDMPTTMPGGLTLAAVPEREDARDVAALPLDARCSMLDASERGESGSLSPTAPTSSIEHRASSAPPGAPTSSAPQALAVLAHGARIGTSGPRRRAMLAHYRPDLALLDIRGNLDTRLRKLDEGQYDALILAAAGLRRLGWADRISLALPLDLSVPAVGQGALGIQCRGGDAAILDRLSRLDDPVTRACVTAERAALSRMGASCTLPFGAHAELHGGEIVIRGAAGAADGRVWLQDEARGPAADPGAVGEALAERLLAAGAGELLAAALAESERG